MSENAVARPLFTQRTRLSDDVASHMRDLIMTGERRPAQVVNIDSFAREIGVSATPVREAFTRLVSEGFLIGAQNRGFIVAPLERRDVEDIFAHHAQIGGELAARAARNTTPEFVAELEQLQTQIDRCVAKNDLAGADEPNTRFHEAVVRQAASSKLAWLFDIGVRYVPRGFFYPEVPTTSRKKRSKHISVDDHRPILDAMRTGDPDKARETMTAHISHASKHLIEHLESIGLWGVEPRSPERNGSSRQVRQP